MPTEKKMLWAVMDLAADGFIGVWDTNDGSWTPLITCRESKVKLLQKEAEVIAKDTQRVLVLRRFEYVDDVEHFAGEPKGNG